MAEPLWLILSRWWDRRTLGARLALVLVAAGLSIAAISWLMLRSLLMPAFAEIEYRVNRDQLGRARHSLGDLNREIGSDTLDYAVWDDAWAYVAHPDREFEAETLSPVAYQNMNVDLVGVVRFDRQVVWSQVVDLASGKVVEPESRTFAGLLAHSPLFDQARARPSFGTYVRTGRGLYALHTAWVTRSDGSGPVQGFLVKARLLSAGNLSKALQVRVGLALDIGPEQRAALLASRSGTLTRIADDHIENSLALTDASGKLLGAAQFSTQRDISAAGQRAVTGAAAAMLFNLFLFTILIGMSINRVGVRRLARLQGHMKVYQHDRSAISPDLTRGSDEIASLAREFDGLIANLREAEELLRQRSYLQGKADSASGLLHNVRNALAPVLVTFEKWLHQERLPYLLNLRRALDGIEDPSCDESRRADLQRFIAAAARKALDHGDGRFEELVEAREAIDQIILILSGFDYDSTARAEDELVDLEDLLARETRQLSIRLADRIAISLPGSVPPVLGNRIHLAQILSNLLVNAVEAMEAAKVPAMAIVITAQTDEVKGTVSLRIADNGEGGDPDRLAQAFQRGYSTRSNKSGGIGLHWCANTIRAMGGSLRLESEGPGKGATAILQLRLPLAAGQRPGLTQAA